MFGYVMPLKPELKIKDFDKFKGYYCGVCFSIKKNIGNIPRLLLNYDMTFLAVFLDSLNKNKIEVQKKRCIASPTKKKVSIINNQAIDYAAYINVALAYFKLEDDVNDDNSIKSKIGHFVLKGYNKKFPETISNINNEIRENLKELSELENGRNFTSIDEIADPFSKIVGMMLESYPYEIIEDTKERRKLLYSFGYTLGKWIYLIDALDDLEEDMLKGKFNPINYLYNRDNKSYAELKESIKERMEFSILNCAYNCQEIMNKLELNKNNDIVDNIISLGMMDKYLAIVNKCKCKGEDKNERNRF